jgi:hypothetical protein
MDEQLFYVDQRIFYLGFKDPFAALLGSYFSAYQNISDYIIHQHFQVSFVS